MMIRTLGAGALIILSTLVACGDKDTTTGDDTGASAGTGDGTGTADDTGPSYDVDADDDGDGLTNGEETELGTDMSSADTDGDGYTDFEEHQAGSDPTDGSDVIYTGGWPYNANKDDIIDPGWNGRAREGTVFPNFISTDQFGEEVELYDFAFQGKPILVDVSGLWCYYCLEAAKWLEGMPSFFDDPYYNKYDSIPNMVANGDIYWITIIDGNAQGYSAEQRDVETWYNAYPNEHVPVILDSWGRMAGYMGIAGYPSMMLLEEDMTVGVWNNNYTAVWDELITRY